MYLPSDQRYAHARDLYTRCSKSGVLLPKVSLGLWHNFGGEDPFERSRAITRYAFDNGITHFDLANNYGVPAGSAEHFLPAAVAAEPELPAGKLLQKAVLPGMTESR